MGHTEFEIMGQLCADDVAWPLISNNLSVQLRYERMRASGESHNMAEILATRAFPNVRTDSTFLRDTCNGKQFEDCPLLGDHYRSIAEQAGVDTTGKVYKHSLASFPGDPTAWVGSRGDVQKVCEAKGFNCSGAVDYQCDSRDPIPDIEVADDLIQDEVDSIMSLDPGYRREDVVEKVREIRTGQVDPNPILCSGLDEADLGVSYD